MILLTTTINIAGVRIMAQINNVGVAAELVGAAGLIILYIINIERGPSVLVRDQRHRRRPRAGATWGRS